MRTTQIWFKSNCGLLYNLFRHSTYVLPPLRTTCFTLFATLTLFYYGKHQVTNFFEENQSTIVGKCITRCLHLYLSFLTLSAKHHTTFFATGKILCDDRAVLLQVGIRYCLQTFHIYARRTSLMSEEIPKSPSFIQ